MFLLKINLFEWLKKIIAAWNLSLSALSCLSLSTIKFHLTVEQMIIVGPESLSACIVTAFFIGVVFTLQVVKEFLCLDATSIIGAVLSLAFIRELSPVLTAVIIVGRVGSSFTAEIATMKVTDQIDALYLLKTDPLLYLVIPRMIACVTMLPLLSLISLFTSLASSIFACFIFYDIHPWIFLKSAFSALSYLDFLKSLSKTIIFGFILSNISCSWGLTAAGGSRSVGQSTTSSVVTGLLMIFVTDFILSYLMFHQSNTAIKSL